MYVLLRKYDRSTYRRRPGTDSTYGQKMVRVGELAHKNTFILYSILTIRSIIITFVKMKVSASLIATWFVLSSSGGWVSVKNDEVEATVVAVLCVAAFLL